MDKSHRGFTLIEMIMVITILGVISLTLSFMLVQAYKTYFLERDSIQAVASARFAMERMCREIQNAEAGSFTVATANEIKFIDNASGHLIDYTITANNMIMRYEDNLSTQPLLADLTPATASFSYLSQDGITAPTNPGQIYYVTIDFSLSKKIGIGDSSPTAERFVTTVYLRNGT